MLANPQKLAQSVSKLSATLYIMEKDVFTINRGKIMEEKKSALGVQISQRPLSLRQGLLSLPLYMIHELPRLVAAH